MLALIDFYEGVGHNDRRKGVAYAALANLRYTSERALPYHDFVPRLHGIFQLLRECGKPKDEDEKVSIFFEMVQHPDLMIQRSSAMTLYRRDGNMSFQQLSTLFAFDVQALPAPKTMNQGRRIEGVHAGSHRHGACPRTGITDDKGEILQSGVCGAYYR